MRRSWAVSEAAASGQLVVLAGGDLTKVRPILEVFGTVTECGAVGHGAALKVVLINAVIAGVTVVGEAMALGDALGLPEELVTGALANGPLAGIASRAFARGANYPLRLAAKDVTLATASADLPLLRIVHDWLIAFPNAGSEDLGQIVRHIRAQRQDGYGNVSSPRLDWPVLPMIDLAADVYDSWLARGTATEGRHGGLLVPPRRIALS